MLDQFRYPGTLTLRNRFGVRSRAALEELEAAAYTNRRTQPVPSFAPDLAGLKAVHRHLFQDIYEWAGTTRDERVIVDGVNITPHPHYISKGDVRFEHSSEIGGLLQDQLLMLRGRMDALHQSGHLDKGTWAALTTTQIGTINAVHPFNEGNGRAMRRFIEVSAEHYGFQARIIGGPMWVIRSRDAMEIHLMDGLRDLILDNTSTAAEAGKHNQDDEPTTKTLLKGAAVDSAAAMAVPRIKDPQRRAKAQQLLDGMRTIEAKQRSQTQSRSPDKPEAQNPGSSRDRPQDLDR